MAPEVLRKESYEGEKVDMFSLGVIIFTLVTASAPFVEARANDIRYKYLHHGRPDLFWNIV